MSSEAENLPGITREEIFSKEVLAISGENLELLRNALAEGIEDGSVKSNLDPLLTSIFLIRSTRAMIELPPGFEKLLKKADVDKDATVKFTLQALWRSIQKAGRTEKELT